MSKKIDYIIVGLGLAGGCLAIQLLKRGKSIMVFDTPIRNKASAVAAGLFNPITGKRIVKTWKADEIFSYLHGFYKELEKDLNLNFFHSAPLYTPFRSIEEQNEWMGKSADASFEKYIIDIKSTSSFGDEVHDSMGGILLSQCGYIKTNTMLAGVRNMLIQNDSYREEYWDEAFVKVSNDGIEYKDIEAQKVIYCNGIEMLKSKFFSMLPLKALKGEVITIKTPVRLNRIYNRGVYIVEFGNEEYKVGATYDLANLKEGITIEGKNELEQKTKDLLNVPFEITHQDWGIRPSTIDRRPLIGEHPALKNILVFNGLGTKGVSLAPYFSKQLAEYLVGAGNLDKEANINRVKSLY